MNIFNQLMHSYDKRVRSLGNSLPDDERSARLAHFATVNPSGFKKPSKADRPKKKNADGTTRRERRLQLAAHAFSTKPLSTPEEHRHSGATQ